MRGRTTNNNRDNDDITGWKERAEAVRQVPSRQECDYEYFCQVINNLEMKRERKTGGGHQKVNQIIPNNIQSTSSTKKKTKAKARVED